MSAPASISFDLNDEKVLSWLRKRFDYIKPNLEKAGRKGARILLSQIKKNLDGTRMIGMKRAWHDEEPIVTKDMVTVKVSSGGGLEGFLAKLREKGGTVRPGSGTVHEFAPRAGMKTRALAIPFAAGVTSAGISRGNPVSYGLNGLFQVGRPGQSPLLAKPGGIDTFRFVLAKSATIRPHPYFTPAISESRQKIVDAMRQAVIDAVVKGKESTTAGLAGSVFSGKSF